MFHNEDNFLRPYLDQAKKLFSFLSNEDLNKILNDEISLQSIVGDIEEFKKIEDRKKHLMITIRSSSECNLSKESCILENMQCIFKLSLDGEKLTASVEDKILQLDYTSQETALSHLKTATDNIEKESDEVAEKFLNSSIGVDVFLASFISSRIVMHMRKFKLDKLIQLVNLRKDMI